MTRRLLFLVAALAGPLPSEVITTGRQRAIEKLIATEMSRQSIPGLSVAVGVGAEVWSAGYGFADLENYVPAKGVTVYRTASVAKPMTAVGILQLVDAGKIELDAPVQRYVPSFPKKPWPITIRQLLSHQSGIRHYQTLEEIDSTRHYKDTLSALKLFENDPLTAEPGTAFHYTTYGYVLLGATLESVTSQRYADYMRQHVWGPAGMERTRTDYHYAVVPDRARGYHLSTAGQIQNCALADTSNKIAGGGLLSTSEDLVRFGLAVRDGKVLRRGYIDLMFLPAHTKDGKKTSYGLGWKVERVEGERAVWHDGGQQGVSTMLLVLPKDGVAVAIMCNLERASLFELGANIARVMTEAGFPHQSRTRH